MVDFDYMTRLSRHHKALTFVGSEPILTEEEETAVLEEIKSLKLGTSPSFLGDFRFTAFGEGYGRGRKSPPAIRVAGIRMKEWIEALLGHEQRFNCLFVQVYRPGAEVGRHKDPKSNKGQTVILPLGDFTEGKLRVHLEEIPYQRRVPISIPCTTLFEGKEEQGPSHYAWHRRGTRVSIILNTIV
jgi:hypothetical protein